MSAVRPIPACRIVAVTLPPTLLCAFIVSLIAVTGIAPAQASLGHPLTLVNERFP
jgi:hypothetical protein